MPDPGFMTAKMRTYMESLSPAARAMMVRAMRNAQQRGEVDLHLSTLAQSATAVEPAENKPRGEMSSLKAPMPAAPWDEQIRHAFFAPVLPFTCNLTYATKIAARIQRASLDAIWTYLLRDLAPVDFAQALALGTSDTSVDANLVARKLRRDVTPKIVDLLQSGDMNSKSIRRLAAQLGSEMALQDLTDVVYIFQKEGAFLNLTGQLPKTLTPFELSDIGPASEVVKKTINDLQIDPTFVAVLLMQRATSIAAVAVLAMTLAGTTDPRLLQSSPYGRLAEAVIAEVELMVNRVENHLHDRTNRMKSLEDLHDYHDLVRHLELSLQPNQVPVWHRQLGAARKQMSDLIGREVEPLPGLIRRALKVESAATGFAGGFDAETVDDAEFGLRLLLEARNALDSLALNELVTKLRRPVEQTIEVITAKLMTDLKSGAHHDRPDMLKAIDAAIRLSAVVFGEDYAALMRKSRDNAVNKPSKSANG